METKTSTTTERVSGANAAGERTQKTVEWAYATSSNAVKFGFGSTGCYVVEVGTPLKMESVKGFETEGEAITFAWTLAEKWSALYLSFHPMRFVASWFETDSFNGKTSRNYRDFWNEDAAHIFAAENHPNKVAVESISECPWHHSHSSLPLSKANAGEVAP